MADAGLVVIGVITLLIWLFGYIPFICFHLLRFYNFRFDITLSKRYPNITLITVASLIIWILMFVLEIIRLFFDGPAVFETIFDFVNIGIYFVFSCSILWRFWLSYYDIQFSIATSSREWQIYIDTDPQYDNWYFKNKKTYGDYTWTKMRFLIGTTILVVIFVLMYVLCILCIIADSHKKTDCRIQHIYIYLFIIVFFIYIALFQIG